MSVHCRSSLHYALFVLCCTLWSTLCFAVPYFSHTYTAEGGWLAVGHIVAVVPAIYLLLYIVALDKRIFAVFLALYDIAGSIVVWGHIAYAAILTPTLVDAAIHSNMGSTMSLVSVRMCLWFLFNAVATICFVWFRFRHLKVRKAWRHFVVSLLLLIGYYHCNIRLTELINSCFPYNFYHNVSLYLCNRHTLAKERQEWPTVAEAVPDSMDVVLVIGESCRADHLGLNGYERQTTPLLSARRNLVSPPHIYTDYTHTMASVPHILTAADSLSPDRAYTESSLVKCFSRYNFRTMWISNQDKGRTYATFIAETDTAIFPRASKAVLGSEMWLDGVLLPPLRSLVASEQAAARNLYVLHGVGSHWYYNSHVPVEMQYYQPVTDNKVITQNTPATVINSYDNTVLYLDAFLDSVITMFEDRNAVVIYLSDHGESLGENGRWLHATEGDAEKNPACVIWYSDSWASCFPDKAEALQANYEKRYRTDFLFHSILSAAGISSTDSLTRSMDMFTR